MAILIINLGTSELAVKIEEHYFPLKFNRKEPNIILPPKGSNEEALWNQREDYIEEFLCEELKLDKTASFRDLTKKILEEYEQNFDYWHQRLRPGRIWGVINTAQQKYQVQEVYCFVTNQPPEDKSGYPTDSIHLFEILKKWFAKEIPNLILKPKIIDFKAVDQDALFNYYYEFFHEVSQEQDKILISIKGGTGQMQTALRIQAMASMVEFQANLEPELDIVKLLHGKPSPCKLNAYWQYIRNQKYLAVKQLLQRWDFDGSIQLLKSWQNYLETLIQEKITDDDTSITDNNTKIKQIIAALNIAVDCFNLDNKKASRDVKKTENNLLRQETSLFKLVADDNYDRLLNIYTQCRIYWELNQIANFLARLSSFVEETLHHLIRELGGVTYFDKVKSPDNWDLDKNKVEPALWSLFEKREGNKCNYTYPYRLPGRFSKRNFVDAMIQYRDNQNEKIAWERIKESLDKLDYWIQKRNQIVHSAEGVSQESMQNLLSSDRSHNVKYSTEACPPAQIIQEITHVSKQTSLIIKKPQSQFVGINNAPLFIYSDIINWVEGNLI